MRKKLVAGNWKMHKNGRETRQFIQEWLQEMKVVGIDVLLCPPFTAIHVLEEMKGDSGVQIGAQNLFWEMEGAYTGEISARMLIDAGCQAVLVGHSERRQILAETDGMINSKIKMALQEGLLPILCMGETLEQRQQGQTQEIISRQVDKALQGVSLTDGSQMVIAYEPIWAIGTGVRASEQDAGEIIHFIRQNLSGHYGEKVAQAVRILYGGSVNPDNIMDFMDQEDIDGALVGGASLDAQSFARMVRLVQNG